VHGARFILLDQITVGESGERITGGISWVLLSANNRPLGKSTREFASSAQCRAAALELRDRRNELRVVALAVDLRGHWGWRIELDGEPAASCTRPYLRQRECEYNLRRFQEALPTTEVVSTVRVVENRATRLAAR
jgi:hypothetical protein